MKPTIETIHNNLMMFTDYPTYLSTPTGSRGNIYMKQFVEISGPICWRNYLHRKLLDFSYLTKLFGILIHLSIPPTTYYS